jgi:hypothetical protein
MEEGQQMKTPRPEQRLPLHDKADFAIQYVERDDSHPTYYKITLNGHEIQNAVKGVRLRLDAGDPRPAVVLELAVYSLTETALEPARVWMTDETWNLLVDAGWEPPAS